jgi:phage portal protein BeeE
VALFRRKRVPERSSTPLSFDEWASWFGFMGNGYVLPYQTLVGNEERIGAGFTGMVAGAYQSNGVVFACELVRVMLFSEARFQFRQIRNGRPGDLFGTAALAPLEEPWPSGTTGDLLGRMILDADLAGNAFVHREGDQLRRLRPDWITIVMGGPGDAGPWDLGSKVLGYVYQPGGPGGGQEPVVLRPETVAHFAPLPDPLSPYRGMSWITPVIREIESDSSATVHKRKFFENGATVNLAVVLDASVTKEMFEFVETKFREGHEGAANAYRTLFLGGGADVKAIGANLEQADFKATQGAGETRIAAASGVHPTIVGLSEGLQGSSLNAGNFGAARRVTADKTLRPLWRNVSGSLARIIDVPAGAELWYDDRDIAFLREDSKDAADIQQIEATAIRTLVDAGFEPDSVVAAITSGDMSRLVHTGLAPVQVQPGSSEPAPAEEPSANGEASSALAHRG